MTIKDLERLALVELEEWLEEFPGATHTEASDIAVDIASGQVPVMVTELFQLVVDDNALAWVDSESMSTEPFAVLAAAVKRRIVERLDERLDEMVP